MNRVYENTSSLAKSRLRRVIGHWDRQGALSGFRVNQDLGGAVACGLLLDGLVALPAEIEYSDDVNIDHEEHERKESRTISN